VSVSLDFLELLEKQVKKVLAGSEHDFVVAGKYEGSTARSASERGAGLVGVVAKGHIFSSKVVVDK
jgi:hypothetical protein